MWLAFSLKPCLSAKAMWLFLSLLLCNALYNAICGNHVDTGFDINQVENILMLLLKTALGFLILLELYRTSKNIITNVFLIHSSAKFALKYFLKMPSSLKCIYLIPVVTATFQVEPNI